MLSPRFEGTPFPMLPPEAQSLYAYNINSPIIYNIHTHILSFFWKSNYKITHSSKHSSPGNVSRKILRAEKRQNMKSYFNKSKSNCIKVKITKYLVNRNDWLEKFAKDEVSLRQVFENLEKYKDNSFENICNVLKISLLKTLTLFWKEVFWKPWQCFENHLHPHVVCEIRSPILEERLPASRNIHNVMKFSRNVYNTRKPHIPEFLQNTQNHRWPQKTKPAAGW